MEQTKLFYITNPDGFHLAVALPISQIEAMVQLQKENPELTAWEVFEKITQEPQEKYLNQLSMETKDKPEEVTRIPQEDNQEYRILPNFPNKLQGTPEFRSLYDYQPEKK